MPGTGKLEDRRDLHRLFPKQRVQPRLGDGLVFFGLGASGGDPAQDLYVGEDGTLEFVGSSG
jgi:hypothetical protein